MRHPTDGTLRRLVDDPMGVADDDREHVATCTACLTGLSEARQHATSTRAALDPDAELTAAEVDLAWHRLSRAGGLTGDRATSAAPARRRRTPLRSPVVAAVGVAVLLGGAGAAAAADWLPIFRTEQVAAVTITQADLVDLPDLSAYGDLAITQEPDVREVADAQAAEAATDLTVPEVADLPQGVTGDPTYQVGDEVQATFTFSAQEAAAVAEAEGEQLPTPPAGLDGSEFRLAAGPGVGAVWSSGSGLPGLVVARAVAPTAYSSGISFGTARDYLLSLPGLPDNVAAQLRGFSGDGTTLPLPVPAGEVTSSRVDVDGEPATTFETRDGTLAGVVWVEDGVVTAVAGSMSVDEVLSVARGLQE